ncbi:S-layer homology domain-containing protein [Aminipila butyrica]|uniref:S-layer homology domain-containing protein n=1 Tax=Aminipila butyrica TaxID=433296 RepID=A0A858BVL0_9FIRM|nr:S-layer homology domain-containing protein [Aminipila butyrica]QIB69105.1 S-layer homology domain-containing protein [Aminipila butyrica]
MKISKMIAMGLALTVFGTTNVFAFTDITADSELSKAVKLMADYKIVNGYEDGSFKPQKEVTRAEFVKMTNKLFSYKEKAVSESFNDVNKTDWFYEDILKAVNEGYILGYADSTFKPNDTVTTEQICVILDRILNLEKTVAKKDLVIQDKVSGWAADSVNRVISSGIINLDRDGNFKATQPASRGTVVLGYDKIIQKKLVVLAQNDTKEVGQTGNNGTSGGGASKPDKPESEKPSAEIIQTMKLASTNINTTGVKYLTTNQNRSDLVPFLQNISRELDKYISDSSYDLKTAASSSKKDFKNRPEADQKILKSAISVSFDISNEEEYKALQEAAKFFGVDINKIKG